MRRDRKWWEREGNQLLLLILIPTVAFAVIGQLTQFGILNPNDCPCYQGLSGLEYAIELLFAFMLLNFVLLPMYFWKKISSDGKLLFIVAEFFAAGWIFFIIGSNLSTTNPTPDSLVLISAAPVAALLTFGYILRRVP